MDEIALCVALWLTGQVPLGIAIGYGIRRVLTADEFSGASLETPGDAPRITRLPLASRLRADPPLP